MRRRVEATDVTHQFLFAAFAVVIHLNPVAFVENVDIKAILVLRFFEEKLDDPFAGKAVHHRR